MSKSNKYKVNYKFLFNNTAICLYIKKLNISIYIVFDKPIIEVLNYFNPVQKEKINNFYIHPNLINLIKSNDILNKMLARELLLKEFNERTRKNSK